jgi:hypothetical protein
MIIGGAILTLAILNPLLCILHCTLPHPHAPVRSGDHVPFLCNVASDTQPATAPVDQPWNGLRAVYEVVLPVARWFVLITAIVVAFPTAQAGAPQHIADPSFPPPKILPRSYVD